MGTSVSVVISTYNKSWALAQTLDAIKRQRVSFDYEIVVVDDGSSDDTEAVCEGRGVEYVYHDRPYPCGPAEAVNVGYRKARGDIILCMNDDIVMQTETCMEALCIERPRMYNVGAVWDLEEDGTLGRAQVLTNGKVPPGCVSCGESRTPMFAMTALRRDDIYAVGGRDEDFTHLFWEDVWFSVCLTMGRGLKPVYLDEDSGVSAYQLWHARPDSVWGAKRKEMSSLLQEKVSSAAKSFDYKSSGGAWRLTEAK